MFSIRYPEQTLLDHWKAQLRPGDHKSIEKKRRLTLINQMLPTRLWITETDNSTNTALARLVRLTLDDDPGWRDAFFALLE